MIRLYSKDSLARQHGLEQRRCVALSSIEHERYTRSLAPCVGVVLIVGNLESKPAHQTPLSFFFFFFFFFCNCTGQICPYRREVTVLGDLLQAQISMSEWQFLPAILALQSVDTKLNQWKGLVPLGSRVSGYCPFFSFQFDYFRTN